MKRIVKWFRTTANAIALSLYNVEKKELNNLGYEGENSISMNQRVGQGTLADSLINGELTEEVKSLRWRMHKISKKVNNLKIEKGKVIKYRTPSVNLKKAVVDDSDSYIVEYIKYLNNETLSITQELNKVRDEELFKITYNSTPRFDIVKYAKKLNVKIINEKTRMLELYVEDSKDPYDNVKGFLLNSLNKSIKNVKFSSFLDINSVYLISDKDNGVEDGFEFEYDNIKLIKVVKYKNFYVIKLSSNVKIDRNDITKKYINKELELKYKNKERK